MISIDSTIDQIMSSLENSKEAQDRLAPPDLRACPVACTVWRKVPPRGKNRPRMLMKPQALDLKPSRRLARSAHPAPNSQSPRFALRTHWSNESPGLPHSAREEA